ncbi:12487_t:CDS:2 [Gigaspora rosea]|nr:12487_t:CDS:2 [Gigaspora rosea]
MGASSIANTRFPNDAFTNKNGEAIGRGWYESKLYVARTLHNDHYVYGKAGWHLKQGMSYVIGKREFCAKDYEILTIKQMISFDNFSKTTIELLLQKIRSKSEAEEFYESFNNENCIIDDKDLGRIVIYFQLFLCMLDGGGYDL